MCIIDCLSTIVFILPLHLDYTKVIILILWWRNFQLEYWRTFQLVSTIKACKAKYLAFISCLLEKPDLSVKTALKSIFRKSQVRTISEKFGLNLNAQIVCLSPSQWLNCFLEMLEVVPEKFHPS